MGHSLLRPVVFAGFTAACLAGCTDLTFLDEPISDEARTKAPAKLAPVDTLRLDTPDQAAEAEATAELLARQQRIQARAATQP